MLDPGELRKLLDGRRRRRPVRVAKLDGTVCTALNCGAEIVYLTWPTIVKQDRRHRELTLGDYLLLPHLLETGLVVQDTPMSAIIAAYEPEPIRPRLFRIAIKTDWLLDGLFIQSFHRLEVRKLTRIRRWPIIREFR